MISRPAAHPLNFKGFESQLPNSCLPPAPRDTYIPRRFETFSSELAWKETFGAHARAEDLQEFRAAPVAIPRSELLPPTADQLFQLIAADFSNESGADSRGESSKRDENSLG